MDGHYVIGVIAISYPLEKIIIAIISMDDKPYHIFIPNTHNTHALIYHDGANMCLVDL